MFVILEPEVILVSIHNICFYGDEAILMSTYNILFIEKIIFK